MAQPLKLDLSKHPHGPDLEEIKTIWTREKAWGLLTSVDLSDCDPQLIRSAKSIEDYVTKLCDLLGVRKFGPITVVDFGEDESIAGFSMTQLIETSLISGHFVNVSNKAFIDVFSCKPYNPSIVSQYTKEYFKSPSSSLSVILRA